MAWLSAFLCGAIFAIGLGFAGMTRPEKILGFLDFTGRWDPSLVLVMGGAVGLTLILFPQVFKRGKPVWGNGFDLPLRKDVDARLVGGAAIFGVGWGLSGYCPGPALVSLVSGHSGAWIFVACLIVGLAAGRWINARQPAATVQTPGASNDA